MTLQRYVSGSRQDLFNGHRNYLISRVVVIDRTRRVICTIAVVHP
jgi:hypothetical protein